ncbi:response regulator [Paraburkholderia unamae]|uniref:Two-component system phosphate regulon response regulator OmpR n=1 Tax=Paraburkholderia unamae TaxID=219649 RepID=A0ABX5KPU5_9BURK|nr:two-component system phosphate regulon response regulator OmpR [Paraburkholderia unamae]
MPPRILVVDADAGLRDPANRYLANQGFEISILRDAGSLQHQLRRNRPDLIVLDVMMPGAGTLTALRNLLAAGDEIPVVMLTARVDVEDSIVGVEPGADDYLGKSSNPRELLARTLSHEDRLLRLSEREFALVKIFAAASMHVFTSEARHRQPSAIRNVPDPGHSFAERQRRDI